MFPALSSLEPILTSSVLLGTPGFVFLGGENTFLSVLKMRGLLQISYFCQQLPTTLVFPRLTVDPSLSLSRHHQVCIIISSLQLCFLSILRTTSLVQTLVLSPLFYNTSLLADHLAPTLSSNLPIS